MGFKKANIEKEKKILSELVNNSPEAKESYEVFQAEYNFRKEMVQARIDLDITQKELSDRTGLSQQMISRIETGFTDTTVSTLCKYLRGLGYSLSIVRNN